jgi:putative ABC transport system permease protein
MFRLAFRNIFRNRLRTALTLAAIVCGVAAVILSGGFIEDVFIQLRESTIHSRLGHIQITRQGYLEFGQREPARYFIESAEPVVEAARALPQVREVMTRVNFSGLANNGRADLPIIGEGVEPGKETQLGSAIDFIAGRNLSDDDNFGVVVGEGVATALKLEPGKPLNLTISTPDGALNTLEFTVTGIFRSFSKDYDDRAVRIPLAAAQELLYTGAVHSVVIALIDTAHTDAVVAQLSAQLGKQGFEVKPWHELADFYNKTVALYKRQFGALQLIILIMLVLSVTSTINMVIYERTGEFGTLLALGMKRRRVYRLVLLENALLGGVGALLGLLVGVALAIAVTAAGLDMPPPPGSNVGYTATIRIVPWVLAVATATGAISAVLASVLPGRRAARLAIVEALRHNI